MRSSRSPLRVLVLFALSAAVACALAGCFVHAHHRHGVRRERIVVVERHPGKGHAKGHSIGKGHQRKHRQHH